MATVESRMVTWAGLWCDPTGPIEIRRAAKKYRIFFTNKKILNKRHIATVKLDLLNKRVEPVSLRVECYNEHH